MLLASRLLARATSIVTSTIDSAAFSISPASGTLAFDGPWYISTFAQVENSFGEADDQFNDSMGGSVNASANVTFTSADANASAVDTPPNFNLVGHASSAINITDPSEVFASGVGRAQFINSFSITGGSGSVDVNISAIINGLLQGSTDIHGLSAEGDTGFFLQIDGDVILSDPRFASIGPNDSFSDSFNNLSLSASTTLEFGKSYNVLIEFDTEARALNTVPESLGLTMPSCVIGALLWIHSRRKRSS